jgi:hypothetical protein
VAREWLDRRRHGGPRRALPFLAGLVLFGGALLQTVEAVRTADRITAFPSDAMRLVEDLAREPAGNALVPAWLGNVLPAFTSHRVWVGHWFLTPDFFVRKRVFERLIAGRAAAPQLDSLLRAERIRYLVVPAGSSRLVAGLLGERVAERRLSGRFELFVLR